MVKPTLFESLFFESEEKNIPITGFLEITKRCNLDCIHCYHEKARNSQMDFSLIELALNKMVEAGVMFLILSGGEPTSHKDFVKIINLATKLGFSLSIFTNGTLIDDKLIEVFLNSTLTEINISLYAMNEEIHDKITQKKNSFQMTMNALKKLAKTYLAISIKMPILSLNCKEVKKVSDFCNKHGFQFKPDPLITPKNSGDNTPLNSGAKDDELIEAMKDFPQKREKIDAEETKICNAGKNYFAIDSEGDIFPCIQLPYAIGNIKNDSLKELWKSSPFLKKLRSIKAEDLTSCSNCCYNGYCDRCPGLVFIESGNLTGKSISNCRIAKLRKQLDEE
jgi:radical SAM protein with 4Fe4S-binding SPASM domain